MQRVVTSVTRSRVYKDLWLKAMGSTVSRHLAASAALLSAFSSTAAAGTLPPVKLAWDKNPERNVSNYELRYGTASGDYSYKIYTENPTATVTGLQEDTTYYFVVVARNHAGKASPNSKEISYRVNGRVVQPPDGKIVSPAANVSITAGDSVNFSASGKDPNGSALTYRWNFGTASGVSATGGKKPGSRRFDVPGTYVVTLDVTNKLGKSDTSPATRVVTVKAPAHKVLTRKGWKLKYVNSQDEVNYPARFAFDDNPGTFWHTEWGKPGLPPPPHEIQIDLGSARLLTGFQYLPRQDGFVVGNIGSYRFYISADGKKWGKPVATGTFENSSTLKSVFFKAKRGRYVRMVSVTEVHGYNDSAVAELQVLQSVTKKKKAKKKSAPVALAAASASGKSSAPAATSLAASVASPVGQPQIGTEFVGGVKYLTLTVSKPALPDGKTRSVQVSSDLLDWFSGWKHTTVLIDNDELLKVRDNTPLLPGLKRFIRLKTSPN